MLDMDLYLVTRDNPSGPLLSIEKAPAIEDSTTPLTTGVVIGQVLGVAVVIALGVYACRRERSNEA